MNLNSFGETIRRIEAERKAEAESAIAAGWTEADHPHKCCPAETATPQPKRAGRSLEEIERLRDKAQSKARWWANKVITTQRDLSNHDAAQPRFDHGMLQVDLKARNKSSTRGDRLQKELNHAAERAMHFARLGQKYTAQIEKRTP
ncbi:hypothetical protein BLJ79_21520 [Arthrobacter sp. UCD-GKA]|uniref:hypothetical protein n=1 Tax=Arthrobacter sp. UCD-GKA TaxID=1913576 RepID=UPI0008DC8D1E|nr:hypothetical protein [Arthrobacter sp. UCD-GKA]OIH81942.1 hypothetical protein BLJ79_21520 [Arthrobacter sp. UCD-GKA]